MRTGDRHNMARRSTTLHVIQSAHISQFSDSRQKLMSRLIVIDVSHHGYWQYATNEKAITNTMITLPRVILVGGDGDATRHTPRRRYYYDEHVYCATMFDHMFVGCCRHGIVAIIIGTVMALRFTLSRMFSYRHNSQARLSLVKRHGECRQQTVAEYRIVTRLFC